MTARRRDLKTHGGMPRDVPVPPPPHIEQAEAALFQPVAALDALAPPLAEVMAGPKLDQLVRVGVDPFREAEVVILGCNPASAGAGEKQILPGTRGDPGRKVVEFLRVLNVDARIRAVDLRSEEHTSELQSQSNLVCRLLL